MEQQLTVELSLPVAIVYYAYGRKCDHCEEINKGMYQVKDKTLCIGCYHDYMEDLALVVSLPSAREVIDVTRKDSHKTVT